MSETKKQAILLIHGIGKQRPMETLRTFVDTIWTDDDSVKDEFAQPGIWSKPDTVSGSFELRRLTTSKNTQNVHTDFYEFYWAHLMEGTAVSHVLAWAKCLLIRSPTTVPRPLLGAWFVLVFLTLTIAFLVLQTVLPEDWRVLDYPKWLTGLASVVVAGFAVPILKNIIGDAARYLNPAPGNVGRRQEIRTKGVEALKTLHDRGYRRIVVVGHSLGTVIGYDILTHAWPLYNETGDRTRNNPVLTSVEQKVAGGKYGDAAAYQKEQPDLLAEMAENGNSWRVTDFVTMGSPLAHASILLAADEDDLKEKQESREFPTCPPALEKKKLFSYPPDRARRIPHHAALFGPTRWTNLYFPSSWVIHGDLIGGPVAPLFGGGILDVSVSTKLRGGFLSHTLYWDQGKEKGKGTASHIQAVRDAVRLSDPVPPEKVVKKDAAEEE